MRMWMINPRLMCRRHLLGEHVELHMFVAGIRRGLHLQGYLDNRLLEPHNIVRRHEEIARELARRGYRHRSPLPPFRAKRAGRIHRVANLAELARRCPGCRALQENGGRKAASNKSAVKPRKAR